MKGLGSFDYSIPRPFGPTLGSDVTALDPIGSVKASRGVADSAQASGSVLPCSATEKTRPSNKGEIPEAMVCRILISLRSLGLYRRPSSGLSGKELEAPSNFRTPSPNSAHVAVRRSLRSSKRTQRAGCTWKIPRIRGSNTDPNQYGSNFPGTQ